MRSSKTIGVIVPSADVNIEAFYHEFVPEGISVATNRLPFNDLQVHSLEQLVASSEQAAVDLCHAEPDILISSSLTLGCFLDAALQQHIEQRTGVPCITSLHALLKILAQRMPSCRLALLLPYQEEINQLFAETLERYDIHACWAESFHALCGKSCSNIRDIQALNVLDIASKIDRAALRTSGADALLIGASGLDGAEHIPQVEEMLGLPVLLPDQVTLLYTLQCLGADTPIPSLGSVFQTNIFESV